MGSLPINDCVPNDGADRPERKSLLTRLIHRIVHSRWLAMFVVAFAVSWAFHQVDEIARHRIEHQQSILACTIEGVAVAQATARPGVRVAVQPILDQCTKRVDN